MFMFARFPRAFRAPPPNPNRNPDSGAHVHALPTRPPTQKPSESLPQARIHARYLRTLRHQAPIEFLPQALTFARVPRTFRPSSPDRNLASSAHVFALPAQPTTLKPRSKSASGAHVCLLPCAPSDRQTPIEIQTQALMSARFPRTLRTPNPD